MTSLIKHGALHDDAWSLLSLDHAIEADLPEGPLLVPLKLWLAQREQWLEKAEQNRQPLGLWLAADDQVETIGDDLHRFAVIAIDFPKFTDGRGYSSARLLRERLAYQGELRAVGDVQRDQLFYLRRVGFDAFALKDGKDVEAALASFKDFTLAYQNAVDAEAALSRPFSE